MNKPADAPPLSPWDEQNQRLVARVRPEGWRNPAPAPRYNLVVIGGGTAGLVTAAAAAGLGARVALIERHLLGGDCLNTGCVPSKALIHAARLAAARSGPGPAREGPGVDFGAVMEEVRRRRAEISENDSAERFRGLGVDVFLGEARFEDPESVRVGEARLRFARAVIATGSRPAIPAIPGLQEVPWLTNETLFNLTELPSRLAVIGAGPIGCEMAQAFARLGSVVHLFESAHGVLPKEDREAAAWVERALLRDRVRLRCCGRDLALAPADSGLRVVLESHGQRHTVEVDRLLIATGRSPNVEGLALDAAGVRADGRGIMVNDRLQTTNPRIYACGDVCSEHKFTHAADAHARIVVRNALFGGRARASALLIPWCTYTSPELAHVGLGPGEARRRGLDVDTFTREFAKVDRSVIEDGGEGFVRVHVRRGTDRILGATVVGAHAGELIGELTLAIRAGIGLKELSATIHPYPTRSEALRQVGDAYQRTRLTPFRKRLLDLWMRWRRS